MKKSKFRNSIEKVSLFGSCTREGENKESDIDVLIEFKSDAKIGLSEFARLQRMLENQWARKSIF